MVSEKKPPVVPIIKSRASPFHRYTLLKEIRRQVCVRHRHELHVLAGRAETASGRASSRETEQGMGLNRRKKHGVRLRGFLLLLDGVESWSPYASRSPDLVHADILHQFSREEALCEGEGGGGGGDLALPTNPQRLVPSRPVTRLRLEFSILQLTSSST